MSKILFGGSRSVSRVGAQVQAEVNKILTRGHEVIIGDANGADLALQTLLADRGYGNVTVYCSGDVCRNNLGNWKITAVPTGRKRLDFDHYAQKDARMADQADYGLFIWNGKSRGTLNTIRMLLERGRPARVYLSPRQRFVTLKTERDLEGIMAQSQIGGKQLSGKHRLRSTSPPPQPLLLE